MFAQCLKRSKENKLWTRWIGPTWTSWTWTKADGLVHSVEWQTIARSSLSLEQMTQKTGQAVSSVSQLDMFLLTPWMKEYITTPTVGKLWDNRAMRESLIIKKELYTSLLTTDIHKVSRTFLDCHTAKSGRSYYHQQKAEEMSKSIADQKAVITILVIAKVKLGTARHNRQWWNVFDIKKFHLPLLKKDLTIDHKNNNSALESQDSEDQDQVTGENIRIFIQK